MSETERALLVVAIAAIATLTVAVLAALANHFAIRRDRRRQLYGEAFKTALGWREMLYRVRRRGPGQERALIEQFHDLQEQLLYFGGWISSESKYMARSYRRLVRAVKVATEPLIRDAWEADLRPVPGNATPADAHPSVNGEAEAFMLDVRWHLSPWKFRKLAVWFSNRRSR